MQKVQFPYTKQQSSYLLKLLNENIEQFSNELKFLLKINSPATLLFLHHYDLIQHYDKKLETFSSYSQINHSLFYLYCFISNFAPFYFQFYFKDKNIKNVLSIKLNEAKGQITTDNFKPCQVLNDCIQQYFELFKIRDQLARKDQIYTLIKEVVLIDDKQNEIFQFCLNYLKKKTQELIQELRVNLCCRFYYQINQQIQAQQNNIQQFKKYFFPIASDNLKHHLCKTVVGFLNRRGGLILIGIEQEKTKKVIACGIYLKPEDKISFWKFIKESIIEKVFPQFNYQKLDEEIQYFNTVDAKKQLNHGQIFFNKYISMDYVPVANPQTLLNVKDLYITRIKVRPGNAKDLYHLLGQKKPISPQFYIRQEKSVKKKSLKQGLSELIDRLNTNVSTQYLKPYHENCMFSLEPYNFSKQYVRKHEYSNIMRSRIKNHDITKSSASKNSQNDKNKLVISQQQGE